MANDQNPTLRQYSNMDVFGKIAQKTAQGTSSDHVVLVGSIAPMSEIPTTSSGTDPVCVPGRTAIVDGVVYICSAVGGQSGAWTYTWTTAGDPSYANIIEVVQAEGTPLTITNKTVNVTRSSLGLYNNKVKINSADTASTIVTTGTTELNLAPIESPIFTGTPKAPTAKVGTNTTQIATTAFVKAEINSVLSTSDAMLFKGTIGASGSGATETAPPAIHEAGWTYKVITAGTYAGEACEVGDMIICIKDRNTSSNDDWVVVQSNLDGAITGTNDSVAADTYPVAVFNGNNRVIKTSTYTIGKSVPSDAVFTDTLMTQNVSTADATYPILACPTANATANQGAKTGIFSKDVLINPNTGYIRAESIGKSLSANAIDYESKLDFGVNCFSVKYTQNNHTYTTKLDITPRNPTIGNTDEGFVFSGQYPDALITSGTYSYTYNLNGISTVYRGKIVTGQYLGASFNNYTLADACAKGVDTSFDTSSTSTNLPTTKAVADAIKGYVKTGSATKSIQAAGAYTVTFNFEPKIVQIYDPDKIQIFARTEISGSGTSWTVTIRTAAALSAAQTWTVNAIGW